MLPLIVADVASRGFTFRRWTTRAISRLGSFLAEEWLRWHLYDIENAAIEL